ncbi:hypothetical protein VNI00_019283 [Paramarasmius palmivorus]|uniref:Uncharacterized protein n=1 Tax=Paramarasmius palmivorus TaxID=297713 RepID=A0AAW0ANF7_9AGAR
MTGIDEEVCERLARLATEDAPEHIEGEEDPFIRAANNHIRSPNPTTTRSSTGFVAYVVFNGRVKGVHYTCHSVAGFPKHNYRGFRSAREAEAAWAEATQKGILGDPEDLTIVVKSSSNDTGQKKGKVKATAQIKEETKAPATPLLASKTPGSPSYHHASSTSRGNGSQSLRRFWWVVIKGVEPGVYTSESAAREAAGEHSLVVVERLGTPEKAESLWSTALNTGRVTLLPPT